MKPNENQWQHWGTRLRSHVRGKALKWGPIAEAMGLTEAALRHWLNGTRDPNLNDFFKLCALADADPQLILFGAPTRETKVLETIKKIIDSAPELNPAAVAPRKEIEKLRSSPRRNAGRFARRASDQPSQ